MPWKKLLAWATGQVDEALRQKLEFVLEENRVYRALLDRHSPRLRLFPPNLLRSHAYWLRISILALRARQLVDSAQGSALGKTHLIIDRDTKYVDDFRHTLESASVKIVLCPPDAPQCNAFAERFVRSIKEECLSRLIFLSQQHLRTAISTFVNYYRQRRNHQGIENKLIEPPTSLPEVGHIQCRKELGRMLNYYYREAA